MAELIRVICVCLWLVFMVSAQNNLAQTPDQ